MFNVFCHCLHVDSAAWGLKTNKTYCTASSGLEMDLSRVVIVKRVLWIFIPFHFKFMFTVQILQILSVLYSRFLAAVAAV